MRPTPLRVLAAVSGAALAVVCFVVLHPVSDAIVGALGCAVLVAVTVTDLESRRIPNRIVIPAAVAAVAARTAIDPSARWALGSVVCGGLLLVLALVYPAGLGMGDVKLALFLGAWLGWYGLLAIVLGVLSGFVPALLLLVTRGRRSALPYAPFLAIGAVAALLAGHDIVDWYRSAGS